MAIKTNNAGTITNLAGVVTTGFTINGIEKYFVDFSGTSTNIEFSINKTFSSYKYMVIFVFSDIGFYSRPIDTIHGVSIESLLSNKQGNSLCLNMLAMTTGNNMITINNLDTISSSTTVQLTKNTGLYWLDILMIY